MFGKIKELINKHPFDWLCHFVMFFLLQEFSGIDWRWSIGIIIAIEVDQAFNWAVYFWDWFKKLDTWIDILFGLAAILLAVNYF